MPLSNAESQVIVGVFDDSDPLKAIIATHGRRAVMDAIDQMFAERRRQSTVAAAQGALSATVSNWNALASASEAADSSMLEPAIKSVDAAIAAQNSGQIGPRLFAVYAAAKKHLSI